MSERFPQDASCPLIIIKPFAKICQNGPKCVPFKDASAQKRRIPPGQWVAEPYLKNSTGKLSIPNQLVSLLPGPGDRRRPKEFWPTAPSQSLEHPNDASKQHPVKLNFDPMLCISSLPMCDELCRTLRIRTTHNKHQQTLSNFCSAGVSKTIYINAFGKLERHRDGLQKSMVMGDIIKKSLVAKQALGNFHQLKLVMPTVHLPATGLVKHHLTETAETAETAVQPRTGGEHCRLCETDLPKKDFAFQVLQIFQIVTVVTVWFEHVKCFGRFQSQRTFMQELSSKQTQFQMPKTHKIHPSKDRAIRATRSCWSSATCGPCSPLPLCLTMFAAPRDARGNSAAAEQRFKRRAV